MLHYKATIIVNGHQHSVIHQDPKICVEKILTLGDTFNTNLAIFEAYFLNAATKQNDFTLPIGEFNFHEIDTPNFQAVLLKNLWELNNV